MATFDIDKYLADQKAIATENNKIAAANTSVINSPPSILPEFPENPNLKTTTNISDKVAEVYRASKQKVEQLATDIGNIKLAQNPEKIDLVDQFKAQLGITQKNLNAPLHPDPQKNTYAYKNWVASGKPGLEFDPNSPQAQFDNNLARLMSGTSRFAGNVISPVPGFRAADAFSQITPQDIADYQSVKANEASNSPENMDLAALARLDAPIEGRRVIRGVVAPNQTEDGAAMPQENNRIIKTKRDVIDQFLARQKEVNAVSNAFDISHLVDRSLERKLAEQSTKDVEDIQAQYADAGKSWDKGDRLTAAYKALKAAGSDVAGTVKDFANTPEAIIPATLENLPNLAAGMLRGGLAIQAAGNLGNSAELVAKGIESHNQQTGDAIANYDQIAKQYAAGAGAAALETVGDKVGNIASLGAVKSVNALNASLLKPLVNTAAKVGVADTAGVVSKAAGKTGLSTFTEGLTEHFQSPLENIAENVPFDPVNQRVSAVMGMAGGLGMSTPGAVVSAIADKATQISDKRNASEKEAVDFYKASVANDASAYSDPTSETYDPVKAAGVWFTHNQQAETTPEVKAENLSKVVALETQMQADLAKIEATGKKEESTKLKAQLEQVTAMRTRLELETSTKGSQDEINAQRASKEAPVKNDDANSYDQFGYMDLPEYKAVKAKLDPLVKQWEAMTGEGIDIQKRNDFFEQNIQSLLDQHNSMKAEWETKNPAGVAINQSMASTLREVLGQNGESLASGAQPYATRKEAQAAKKLQPHLNLRKVEGGYGLVEKTKAQILAGQKAAQRLNQNGGGVGALGSNGPLAAHELIAAKGGLSPSLRADMNIQGNVGIGNRTLFAGKDKGLNLTEAQELLEQAGYDMADYRDVLDYLQESLGNPQYSNNDVDTVAELLFERQNQAEFADYLAAQKELNNQEESLQEEGIFEEDLNQTGFIEASEDIQNQVLAYIALLTDQGVDASAVVERISGTYKESDLTPDEYYEILTQALADAASSARSTSETSKGSDANSNEDSSQQKQEGKSEVEGGLTAVNEKVSAKGTPYQQRNIFADFFTQNAGNEAKGTLRPLVKVKDFLSKWLAEPTLAEQFVKGKKLEKRQQETLEFFAKTAKAWNPIIQSALFKRKDPSYYVINDPLQFLFTEVLDANGKPTGKFDADENFKSAIAYAAFSLIQDMAGKGEFNSPSTINTMLGRPDDHEITQEEWDLLGKAGTLEDLLVNSAGQVAYEALGLQSKSKAPNDLAAKIKSSMGAHVMKLLIDQGYVQRKIIKASELSALGSFVKDSDTTKYTGSEDLFYFSLTRGEQGDNRLRPLIPELQKIVDSVKESQSVLDKLFSIETALKMPSLEPYEPHQINAKNSDQAVPDTLTTVINKKFGEANKLRQDLWHIVAGFSADLFVEMAGAEDSSKVQKGRRLSVEAKNEALYREYDNYLELGRLLGSTGDKSLDQSFYLDYSVWKQHRVGIATNGFNPNASKLQRQLSYQPDWETKIDRTDSDQMDNFYLRVAEGFGLKTDSAAKTIVLPKIIERLSKEDVKEVVELLRQRIVDAAKPEFTAEEQQKILAVVKQGGENIHSLNSLVALAHLSEAEQSGQDTFTVQIPAEVDGKTNGPMLSNATFGAAASSSELFATLNRGGFFELGNPDTQFNIWKGKGNLDLYESGLKSTVANLKWLIENKKVFGFITDTVLSFTKSLLDPETGKVSSAGRNLMKKPSTEVVYGSSTKTSVDNMADAFIESVYARIEEVAQGDFSQMDLPKLIKELNNLLYGTQTKFKSTATAQDILDHTFSKRDLEAMKEKFVKTLGLATKATVKNDFHAFKEKTKVFTTTAGLTFSIYKAVYDTARKDYIKELVELGEIASIPAHDRKNKNGTITRIKTQYLHDLTAAQEKVLKERILSVYPVMHSLFSKESNQLSAGLFIGKTEKKLSKKPQYNVEVQFATPIKDTGAARMNVSAMQTNQINPGVAMLPTSIQSLDSYISHTVQASVNALNQHDALVSGIGKIQGVAQSLNAATWEAVLNYSPPTEMYDAFVRTILGMEEMVAKKYVSLEALNLLAQSIVEQTRIINEANPEYAINPKDFLTTQLAMMKSMSFNADSLKLATLAQTNSVDQYTFEGGNYNVTNENRAEALDKKSKLTSEIDPEVQNAVDSLAGRLNPLIEKIELGSESNSNQKPDTGINETAADQLTNAQAFALLSHAVKDKKLGEAVVGMLKKVLTKLRESKGAINLVTALKVLQPANRADIAQLLVDRAAKIPANLWGIQGKSLIQSDPQWVLFFEKRGKVTGEQLVRALKDKLIQDGGPSNVKDFNLEMLSRISKLINPKLTIQYVTPATAPSQVIEQAKDNARAWYIATTDGVDTIYVLSADYVHSGLTTETLLHEILHSAVARTIKAEQDARKANPARKSPLLDIIDDLEGLRKAAAKFIEKNPEMQQKFGPAVQDIDELIAWGITNTAFQVEVLNKIQVASRTNNNLITGIKAMLNSLVAILFRKSSKSEQEILGSGLSVLISNVSDLFTEAENKQSQRINESLNRSQTNTAPDPAFYTTAEVYEFLASVSPASMEFDGKLRSLLSGIVNKLHGTAGTLHDSLMSKQALSAEDVYLKALATGQAPFASATVASGFQYSQQEGFVMEQVEATIRAAIERNENTESFAYKELDKLYHEAKSKLSAKDFHDGDWNNATQTEKDTAQELYDFLFVLAPKSFGTSPSPAGAALPNPNRLDHLSRFAALGLANEKVNKLLEGMTASGLSNTAAAPPLSLAARLKAFFDKVLAWFNDRQTGIKPGDKPDARLEKLVETLVDIEAKKRASAMARENALLATLKAATNTVLKEVNDKIERVGVVAARSSNGAVKGIGFLIGATSGGRVNQMIDDGLKFYDTMNGAKPDLLKETVAYTRGASAPMEELFRAGKKIEIDRKAFIDSVSKNLLAAFKDGGKTLTPLEKKAITSLLRVDAQSLLAAGYTLDQLQTFLGQGNQRQAEITRIEDELKNLHPTFYKQFLGQSKQLGYFLATGKSSHENTMLNALNIALMYNTPTMGHLTVPEERAAQALIDPLVSLYALEYSSFELRNTASTVLARESARTDGENGIAATLAMHAYLLKDSKEKLFDGSEVLMTKGYVPEIYNPRTDIQVADEIEGRDLIAKGYSAGEVLPKDANDPNPVALRLYVREDSGLVAHATGMISLTDIKAKGSSKVGKNRNTNTWVGQLNVDEMKTIETNQRQAIDWMAQNGDTFDPQNAAGVYMIPTLNRYGEPSNYRYIMNHVRKDSVLERNNNFENVLGVFAGNTFDKVASATHNAQVIKALHDHYKADYAGRSMSYVEIGPNSSDPAMQEVYRLLPEATKKEIEAVWGSESMMVRNDMVTLAFGYRKFSLSEMFDKDPSQRNAAEELFVSVANFVVAGYARLNLGMDVPQSIEYAKRTGVVVKRAEDAWKTISDEVKNIVVVKTGIVLLGNVWSNATLLMMHGISLVDIAKHHKTAFTAARNYQETSEELFKLQTQLNTGYNLSNRNALEQRILILKNAIARNPVTELMDAGLMPTIARDVELTDDMYAYDSNFVKNIKANVASINPTLLNIGKQLYMTKDTPHYKMLSNATQLSDFVARYTLYQHLTTKPQEPLNQKEAFKVSSETFVNYDIPLPKGIQYLDDMGIVPFTKYFLSMQRVLINLVREHPTKVLMTLMANNYFNLLPTVMDGSAFNRIGNNPFRTGPLRIVSAVEQILPIKYAMGLFR